VAAGLMGAFARVADAKVTYLLGDEPFLDELSRALALSAEYNGNGTCPTTGNTALAAVQGLPECLEFADNACCTKEQVDLLVSDLKRIQFIIKGEKCRETIRRIFCYQTCSPQQSYAVNLKEVLTAAPANWPGKWKGPTARHLTLALCGSHCTQMYEDCKGETLLGGETLGSQFDKAKLCAYLSSKTAVELGYSFYLGEAGCKGPGLTDTCGPLLEMYEASGGEKCLDVYNEKQYPTSSTDKGLLSQGGDGTARIAGATAAALTIALLGAIA